MPSLRELTLKMSKRARNKMWYVHRIKDDRVLKGMKFWYTQCLCSLVPLPLHLDCSLLTLSPVRSSNAKALPCPLLHSNPGLGTEPILKWLLIGALVNE